MELAKLKKPILTLDFDGVIHSYTSGWKGARIIPDCPVDGALEFIVTSLEHFEVNILSSRSHQWGGRRAMKAWLREHLYSIVPPAGDIPEWWNNFLYRKNCMEPFHNMHRAAIDDVISAIKWPIFKPASIMTIDDRAMKFDGTWPTHQSIKSFKPWNKK